MQLNKLHTILILSLCAVLTACSDEVSSIVSPDNGKTPIELSIGGVDAPEAATRAVITTPKSTMIPFTENTSLYMLMKSDYVGAAPEKPALVTRTIMFALPQSDGDKDYSEVNYSASSEEEKFVRFWDDSYARESALSILAVCTPGMGANVDKKAWNISGSDAGYANRSWETISAGGGSTPYTSIVWPIGNPSQYSTHKLQTDQSVLWEGTSFIKNQDLCFSNNIGDWSGNGGADRRLKFNFTTRRFPREEDKWEDGTTYKTRMVFYHALSKLTFRIKKGEGFTDAEFKFNTNTNIKLSNFYNKGTFDIQEGEFLNTAPNTLTLGNIDKIYQRPSLTSDETAAGYKYILDALVIPGTDMSTSDDAVTFYMNNNEYKLTRAQLYEAFTEAQKSGNFDSNKLKAGVHYVFTFVVDKTRIKNITASIVDWEEVDAAELTPSNARITLNLEERNNNDNSNVLKSGDAFSIYRAADDNTGAIDDDYTAYNWRKNYTNVGANLTWDEDHWKTDWYWDSNKNFYHFRALCEQTSSAKLAVSESLSSDATYGSYLALNHCEKTSTQSYKDILWGAPMLDKEKNEDNDASTLKWFYGPMTKGFDSKEDGTVAAVLPGGTQHQIYKAIGPTEDPIKLILFHMMSDVTFKVKTTTGTDAVNLGDGSVSNATTIKLEQVHTTGKLFLGNGLVQGSTADVANSNFLFTQKPAPSDGVITWANYGAIPQDLTNVVLVITTPDHNQYKVKLWDEDHPITATVTNKNMAIPYVESSTAGKYKINRWYPGFKYTYSFTLAKTGITNIQATILDWESVTADNETVQIK